MVFSIFILTLKEYSVSRQSKPQSDVFFVWGIRSGSVLLADFRQIMLALHGLKQNST